MFSEDAIFQFLLNYAYSPFTVYIAVIVYMLLSGFGFPLPEEVILVSCGIIAYMAHNPQLYPPPENFHGMSVNVYILATVCFFAVMLSDTIVYLLGKYHGTKIFYMIAKFRYFLLSHEKKSHTSIDQLYHGYINSKTFTKINSLFDHYGHLAVGIFRFTPGIRFPGHLSCGMMKVPLWKFLMVDFLVAILSVPTQVILVAYFGEAIIARFKEFKLILLGIGALFLIIYFVLKLKNRKKMDQI